jgi:hypothetical protein
MAKLWIAVGFAAGYVVGAAAGRKQYERIKSTAQDLWERPEVQRTVKKVDEFVGSKAPVAHDLGAALVESVQDAPDQAPIPIPPSSGPVPTPPAETPGGEFGTPNGAGATS